MRTKLGHAKEFQMSNLIEWNQENTKGFGYTNRLYNHHLHNDPIFSDDGLAQLIDAYPKENLEIFTMGMNPIGWGEWFLGRRGNLSGRHLLEAVKKGRIWLNLRKTNSASPHIQEICDKIFQEIHDNTDAKTFKHDMGLLISSPKAHVYYHADMPLVMLWQIRGIKRVYLYPAEEPLINDKQLEAIAIKESDEQLKFDPEFEKHAFVHDLQPGEFLTWIQNCPHRIENQDCLNVSFSVEFLTPKAAWRANLLYANGCLRRYFGLNPKINNSLKILEPFKILFARAIKFLGGYKGKSNLPQACFSLDEKELGKLHFDTNVAINKEAA